MKKNNNLKLNEANKVKNDEWYTPKEDVIKIVNNVRHLIKGKTIWLPFNDKDSEFDKYFKKRIKELQIDLIITDGNYEDHIEAISKKHNEVYVVSNCPFSKYRQIVKDFNKYGIYYIMISPRVSGWRYVQNNLNYAYVYNNETKFYKDQDKTKLYKAPAILTTNFYIFSLRINEALKCSHNTKYVRFNKHISVECLEKHFVYCSLSEWIFKQLMLGKVLDPKIIKDWDGDGSFKYLLLDNKKYLEIYKMIKEQKVPYEEY